MISVPEKRIFVLFLIAMLLYGGAAAESELLVERHFAAPSGYDAYVSMPDGTVVAYYAQNDPLWGAMTYEAKNSEKRRPFRDGGCAPTALAMAIRRVVPDESIARLDQYKKSDYSICPCSLNSHRCNKGHIRYFITSQKDYLKYLPLVFADFACGNNSLGVTSRSEGIGTGTGFYKYIAGIFDLDMKTISDAAEAADAANAGYGVVAYAASGGAFTGTGHYMLLAGADDTRFYFLDPLCRNDYTATDTENIVTIINQGLISVDKSKIHYANIYSYTIFSPANIRTEMKTEKK